MVGFLRPWAELCLHVPYCEALRTLFLLSYLPAKAFSMGDLCCWSLSCAFSAQQLARGGATVSADPRLLATKDEGPTPLYWQGELLHRSRLVKYLFGCRGGSDAHTSHSEAEATASAQAGLTNCIPSQRAVSSNKLVSKAGNEANLSYIVPVRSGLLVFFLSIKSILATSSVSADRQTSCSYGDCGLTAKCL